MYYYSMHLVVQRSRTGLEFKACLETASSFKTLEKSSNCFDNEKVYLKSFDHI